jgi:HEAT repeat protein
MNLFNRWFRTSSAPGRHGQNDSQTIGSYDSSEVLKNLIRLLNDPIGNVQVNAADALGLIGDPRAVKPLITLIRSNKSLDAAKARGVEALGKIGNKDAVLFLESLAQDNKLPYMTRQAVSYVLKKRSQPDEAKNNAPTPTQETQIPKAPVGDMNHLIDSLTDGSQEIRLRYKPAEALCELGDSARTSLLSLLNDKDPVVRKCAAGALGNTKDINAVAPLVTLLRDDSNMDVVTAAVQALGNIGAPGAIQPLFKAIENHDETIVVDIARALVKIGQVVVDSALTELSNPNTNVRLCVRRVLGELKEPRAVDPLIAVILDKTESRHHRSNAMVDLENIGDPKAIKPLLTCLNDSDSTIRANAAMTLGGFFRR